MDLLEHLQFSFLFYPIIAICPIQILVHTENGIKPKLNAVSMAIRFVEFLSGVYKF